MILFQHVLGKCKHTSQEELKNWPIVPSVLFPLDWDKPVAPSFLRFTVATTVSPTALFPANPVFSTDPLVPKFYFILSSLCGNDTTSFYKNSAMFLSRFCICHSWKLDRSYSITFWTNLYSPEGRTANKKTPVVNLKQIFSRLQTLSQLIRENRARLIQKGRIVLRKLGSIVYKVSGEKNDFDDRLHKAADYSTLSSPEKE